MKAITYTKYGSPDVLRLEGVEKPTPTEDEVYGDLCENGWGGYAEFVCARQDSLLSKPAGMTFEEAASIPQAAAMSGQGLRGRVQIAKHFGTEVTAVDNSAKLNTLLSLGADHAIDYQIETNEGVELIVITLKHDGTP